MTESFKGYYLPPSLADVEQKLELEEMALGNARLLIPRLTPEEAYAIARALRENRAQIMSMPHDAVADAYDRAVGVWRDDARPEKQAALKYLPALTGLSPEMIERFHFGSLGRIDRRSIAACLDLRIEDNAFKAFQTFEGMGIRLKGYAGWMGRFRLKINMTTNTDINLVTFMGPHGTAGYYECLGMLTGSMARTSTVVKTDPEQPLFAPMFARSIATASPDIGETIAVLPWTAGDAAIGDAFMRQSDAVSMTGDAGTVAKVEQEVKDISLKQSRNIKGCYHRGTSGIELIAKEYATRDVARLAAMDGIGYEGHAGSSPSSGLFVEQGGPLSPEQFAVALAEEAGMLSQAIPQLPAHREERERKLAGLNAKPADGRRVITTPGQDVAVVYEQAASLKQACTDRLFVVMPLDRLDEIVPLLKSADAGLQTAGIAVPDNRLLSLADQLGKAGINCLRVTGTMTMPKPGEAWDGSLPVLEYYMPDTARWVSINTLDIDHEIARQIRVK